MFSPDTPPALARALAARGYEAATPVQAAVSAPETAGRDLMVTAKTGSGKTVAYGLALAPDLLGEAGALPRAGAPRALVIAPTRELALQVREELAWLFAEAGARVVACVGGMDPRREARDLQAGAHIVVGTPGRLRDHLERGQLDLSGLAAAVLDEADEMLDMGFRQELEAILDAAPAERRTLMFSATLPREIEHLARRYQRDALRLTVDAGGEAHADIAYQAVPVAPYEVERAVVNLLRWREAATAIVFCGTREGVNRLHANLAERGFGAVALSGELTQAERTRALQALRDRRARVCVATDVAARGIDIPDLELVIHADLPHDSEVLLHRSGRTGRAGRKGACAIIVPHPKRRRAEQLIRGAKVVAEWTPAPSADAIRERDAARLVDEVTPAAEDELAAARTLLEGRSAEDIAAALVRLHRARLPSPEDLAETLPEAPAPRRAAGLRGLRLVPDRHRAQPQRRPALAAADDLPPRPRHARRDRRHPGVRPREPLRDLRPGRRPRAGRPRRLAGGRGAHRADGRGSSPAAARPSRAAAPVGQRRAPRSARASGLDAAGRRRGGRTPPRTAGAQALRQARGRQAPLRAPLCRASRRRAAARRQARAAAPRVTAAAPVAVERIDDPADPRLEPFRDVKERDLVGRRGLFLAEGEVVVRQAVRAGIVLEALLLAEDRAGKLADLLARGAARAVYLAPQHMVDALAGFPVHPRRARPRPPAP